MRPSLNHRAWIVLGAAVLLGVTAGVVGQEHPGKAAYTEATCNTCHGPTAKGSVGPSLVPMTRTLPEFTTVVREGVGEMPPFSAEQVSDAKLQAIHDYLKSLGGSASSRGVTPPAGAVAGFEIRKSNR